MLNRYPLLSGRKHLETIMTKNLMGIPRSDELPPLPEPQKVQRMKAQKVGCGKVRGLR